MTTKRDRDSTPNPPAPPAEITDVASEADGLARRLRESEERLQALSEATGYLVWTTPPDGQVEDVPSWRAFTGQSQQQVRGRGWLDAIHPDDRARIAHAWERSVQERALFAAEYRLLRRDGVYRHFEARGVPVFGEQGIVREWVGMDTDITERKALERRLRTAAHEAAARASQLEVTFQAITDGVVVYRSDGGIVQMNAAAQAILRLIAPEGFEQWSIGERLQALEVYDGRGHALPPERRPILRLLAGEELTGAGAMDVVFRSREGREISLSISGVPTRDEDGAITGAVAIYHDVTARHSLERRARDALKALLEMAEVLVRAPDETTPPQEQADEAGAVAQRLAELTCSVLGCSRVGIVAIDMASGRQRPMAVAGLTDAQRAQWWVEQQQAPPITESPFPELTARLLGGEVLMLDMTHPPFDQLPNPYGIRTLLIALMRVREQVVGALSLDHGGAPHEYTSDEMALAEAVAQLAGLVIERERLLRERAAAQANELALRTANQRMDEFLSMASHELRTPLTTLKANVQLADGRLVALGEGKPRIAKRLQPARDLLKRGDRQVDVLNRLVGDLLDVSRIQSNRLDLRVERRDLAVIVRETVAEQRLAHPDRRIAFDGPARGAPVRVDGLRIKQVVGNYLTNALKYSAQEHPVTVALRLEGEPGCRLARVSVRDQGPGLPEDELERIWERFHRVPGIEVQSGSGVGLGLGLHIGRTLVQRHGGQVGVESVVGEGSTFWFVLPLTEE
jgi:PAS domain S-box-containing protein